jgi:opacity protein-like surface antigen
MAYNLHPFKAVEKEMRMTFIRFTAALAMLAIPALANAQLYASGRLGYASAKFALDAPYNGVIDDRSMQYGVTAGFAFGRRWAIEAGYDGYEGFDGFATPCVDGATCPILIQAVDDNDLKLLHLALAPRFTVGKALLYGKFGYYQGRIKTHVGLPNSDFTENGLMLGAGLRWHLSDPWSVSLEATRFDDHVHQISVGFGWGLGRPPDSE